MEDFVCCMFQENDPETAYKNFTGKLVADYGGRFEGKCLFTWDEGGRELVRCRRCGKLVLIQRSEYHTPFGDDDFYTDYFPVRSEEEAEEINRTYDGFQIEMNFKRVGLFETNGVCSFRED